MNIFNLRLNIESKAAISAARRVAFEMDSDVGDMIGYAVRFDENYSPNTVIKYLTGR